MTEELCPVCGCPIVGKECEEEGVQYCCEPWATGIWSCACGCRHPVEKEKNGQIKNTECSYGLNVQGVPCLIT